MAEGPGAVALTMVREGGGTVVGIDVSVPSEGNPYVDDLREIGADGRWPVQDASVDVAFCDWVLEHVAKPELFFAECGRVLAPGGVFIARTMQAWSVAGIGAKLVPSRYHGPMIKRLQPGMHTEDIFPTSLRCNTAGALAQLFVSHGMVVNNLATHETLQGYGADRPAFQRILRTFEHALPSAMHHAIVMTATKA